MDPVDPPHGAPPPQSGGSTSRGSTDRPGSDSPNGPLNPDDLGLFASWWLAARSTARASRRASNATRRTVRKATHAQGAGESGMAKLTELSGLNAAGDIMVMVALAGTLFFSVSPGEARGRVALYLLITMVPFALLAPLIGPLLDRFTSGRRWALAITFGLRAVLVWIMAGGVQDAELWLYPAVFGVLVSSKAYLLIKAAAVPRLLPPAMPLVRANSWINMAGLSSAALAAAIGAPITGVAGPQWTLRLAAVLFALGVVLSIKMPPRIDSAAEHGPADLHTGRGRPGGKGRYVGPSVEMGLRANVAFRGLSGFLTLYLAFLVREHPISDSLSDNVQLSLVIAAAGVGSIAGSLVGSMLRSKGPEVVTVALLIADTAAILAAAIWYSLTIVLAAGFVVGFAQTLGKLALDSMIQRDVEEYRRSSAFARSETRLQLAWVVGGAIGIVLPLRGGLAFTVAGLAMVALTVEMLRHGRETRRQSKAAPMSPPPGPARPGDRGDANP